MLSEEDQAKATGKMHKQGNRLRQNLPNITIFAWDGFRILKQFVCNTVE